MIYLCIIGGCAFNKNNLKIIFIHKFCNVVDSIVFVNIFMLKSPIIMLGELVGIFQIMFSKMELKQSLFICCGL